MYERFIDDEVLSKDTGIGLIECGHGHGWKSDHLMYIYAVSAKGQQQIKKIMNLVRLVCFLDFLFLRIVVGGQSVGDLEIVEMGHLAEEI